ncbi:LysR family transcriptional regulator [Saccharopolyspora flava]|uniref:DNA-binding transcriptional regulator, LysR family n=1 Tax=Saccharopolyspora flava TaxID=95161 RepID=A0A1I6RLY9_9PSEU|nr:LysR family transcriptional regulator [Saccharopolyspora flava]SFS65763.1 DNA-binding transcriptional regulator, LysR family [Saccharopolyspora flava]
MPGNSVDRNLRVDDLRYLLALANTGRLVAAASQLGVDHSTVSRRLRALERSLGAKLLERSLEGWELTEFGRRVIERARPIEDALKGVVQVADGAAGGTLAGNFRITAPDGFGTAFVVPALTRLRQRHPGLQVELLTETRQLSLHQSGFDIAVAIGGSTSRRLFTEKLCDYRLALYATRDYLHRNGSPNTRDELRDHTVVFYVDSLLQVGGLDLLQYLPGVEPRFSSTNVLAQVEATKHGAGIGLLPRFLAVREPSLVELTDLALDVTLSFTLAARRDGISRPALQEVRRALHEEVQQRRAELM